MKKEKPQLSFWQIVNMSFGFMGIQFGFALQNANVSRIFETLGAKVENIPILWIAAPVTGLIIQPIIGHMSDNTWNRLGRRRPYFLTGAILASLALLFMPHSPTLWIAAGTLWIMDASINISMEPFRAFVGDMLPSKQRTIGFAMQSFFIGAGAIIASALPWVLTNWLHVSSKAAEGAIPHHVVLSFLIGGIVFFLAVLYTVLRTKEYPPEELASFTAEETASNTRTHGDEEMIPAGKFFRSAFIWIIAGLIISTVVYLFKMELEVYILGFGLVAFGFIQIVTGLLTSADKTRNGLVVVINDLFKMPGTMVRLAFVQFFSWFALFSMWIYTTAGVTSTKYDMKLDMATFTSLKGTIEHVSTLPESKEWSNLSDVKSDLGMFEKKFSSNKRVVATMRVVQFFTDETKSQSLALDPAVKERLITIKNEYNKGADWVGILMGVYNGFAAVMAIFLIGLARLINRKTVHALSLIIGGISLISFLLIKNPRLLMISELGIGLAWASILAMPYAILTGSLPSNKMGTYMGIFNFFIVIPQIMAASILGFMVKSLFGGESIYALVTGGVSMFIAAFLVLFVHDNN
ncbi:MAG: MFS transporter [Bacteroidales bacterium]|jgi:maltose/moltooligosaccharide transporter